MALLRALAAIAFAGCYAPDLPDCQVACQNSDDCAGDQSCTAGLCTGGAACNGATPDGAPAMPDGGGDRMITIRIEVMGEGKVVIPGVGECNKTGPAVPVCAFAVPAGERTLNAMINKPDKEFDKWTSFKCAGQNAACMDVFLADATVSAKFR